MIALNKEESNREPNSYYGDDLPIKNRLAYGQVVRHKNPGWGSCGRCQRTWNHCNHHTTNYMKGCGCFPLCEPCWKELSPSERLPYYQVLMQMWIDQSGPLEDGVREVIEKAVLAGK